MALSKARVKTTNQYIAPYYPYRDKKHVKQILKMLAKDRFLTTHKIAESLGRKWEYPQNRVIQRMERLKNLGYCEEYNCVIGAEHKCGSKRYLVENEKLEKGLKFVEENKKKGYGLVCKEGYMLGRLLYEKVCYECPERVEPILDEEYKILNERYWSLTSDGEFAVLPLLKEKNRHDFITNHKHNKVLNLMDILLKSYRKEHVKTLINYVESESNSPKLTTVAYKWYNDMNSLIMKWEVDSTRFPELAEYKRSLISLRRSDRLVRHR